jgi:hypothetical protein
MAKSAPKQLVVCINNEGYPAGALSPTAQCFREIEWLACQP